MQCALETLGLLLRPNSVNPIHYLTDGKSLTILKVIHAALISMRKSEKLSYHHKWKVKTDGVGSPSANQKKLFFCF
jgi:hypothetical protein